jgi:hypothetical protein
MGRSIARYSPFHQSNPSVPPLLPQGHPSSPQVCLFCLSDSLLTQNPGLERQDVDESEPLRPLTSLKWPYVPEESAYPDPLKRDDPKIVQLSQYEAIGNPPLLIHITTDTSQTFYQLLPPLCGKRFPSTKT